VGGNLYSDPKAPGLTGPLGGYAINLPSPAFTSGTVFSFGNVANTFRLDAALTAMERKGKGRIISAPRTLTQNNAEATMEQGRQIPVQTIENNTIKIKYVYATLELKVKPQITAEGMIICRLTIKNNAADFANLVNGIPPILTQELVTTVMIRDGSTLVVGGLYKINDESTKDSVPLLSKIPILGNLFKNSQKIRDKTELLIFVTPRIVK
jgi:type IV pilus assembly protein PilQ